MTVPSESDFGVALHVGVHKTATSHLQRSLRHADERLIVQGVRYYGPPYLRQPGRSLGASFSLATFGRKSKRRRSRADQLAFFRKDGHRLVLSEENFIGELHDECGQILKGGYPDAADRISDLAQAIGQSIDVFIAVRHPATFLSSAYSQVLLSGNIVPLSAYLDRNPIAGIDWFDLVGRIRAAPGVGRLTVWRYEDYADVFAQICAGLVGGDAAASVTSYEHFVQRGLSAAAVQDVMQRFEAQDGGDLAKTARKAFPVNDAQPVFDSFDAEQHTRGSAQYDAQLAAMAQLPGIQILRP